MGKKLFERIKYWSQILLLPVYGFSFLIPRNKKIWVFGCSFGKRFADNPRYLYLYISQNCSEKIRPIWISKNKEIVNFLIQNHYESYYYLSWKGIITCLRSAVYVFDNYSKDINFWLSGGAIKVNLWHGSGNKKTNYDNKFDKVRHPKNLYEMWTSFPRRLSDEKPHHYTLATSEAMKSIFMSAFRTDEKHIIIDGYPRNDILFDECHIDNLFTEAEKKLVETVCEKKKKQLKIMAYMPTFRESEEKLLDIINLSELNDFYNSKMLFLIIKLHPKSKIKNKIADSNYTNIMIADADIDVYSFLKEVDLLITDYSSVYTDYILLDRPVIAFHYDWELYKENTRDSYIEHDTYMPEVKVKDMRELEEAILELLTEDRCKVDRSDSRNRMFLYQDGKASERITKKIISLLD